MADGWDATYATRTYSLSVSWNPSDSYTRKQQDTTTHPPTTESERPASSSVEENASAAAAKAVSKVKKAGAEKLKDKEARRRAAREMVVADKGAERAAREQAAVQLAAAKRAAEEAAIIEQERAEQAEADRMAAEALEAERRAAEEAEAQRAEDTRIAGEAAEAAQIQAEIEAAAAEAEAEAEAGRLAAEEKELRKIPAWVRRLARVVSRSQQQLSGGNAEDEAPAPTGAILFSATVSDRVGFSASSPVRVQFAAWAASAKAPYLDGASRSVANTVLVLRASAALDSPVVGKLLRDSEVYVLETCDLGVAQRSLITATSPTAAPLGWVTSMRDGIEFLSTSSAHRNDDYGTLHGCSSFYPRQTEFLTSFKQHTQATSTRGLKRLSWWGHGTEQGDTNSVRP